MKKLLLAVVTISILVLLVSPGLTGEQYRSLPEPVGPGGPVRHVTLYFVHDTITDKDLVPKMQDELGRTCSVKKIMILLKKGGDIVGEGPVLSDVNCSNPERTGSHVEIDGVLIGTFAESGDPIKMAGHMTLDLDWKVKPIKMQGLWIFPEGAGTHHGAFRVEGIVEVKDPEGGTNNRIVGSGTCKGWVRKNEEKPLK